MAEMTARALAAFRAYCALGAKRSLAKLAADGISTLRYLEAWSSKYNWQQLVAAYDAEHEAQLEAERLRRDADAEEARREMLARHAARSRDLFLLAVQRLEHLARADDLDASSAVRLVQVSAQLERLARGVADVVQHQVAGVVTLDQLQQMVVDVDGEQAEWERQRGYAGPGDGSGRFAAGGGITSGDIEATSGAGGDGE
jgi:hypothetical protein